MMRSEPTPESVFFGSRTTRRSALRLCAAVSAAPMACAQDSFVARATKLAPPLSWPDGHTVQPRADITLPEGLADRLTPREVAASHNNFYEFLPGRGGEVWRHCGAFQVEPWSVEVAGLCAKPMTLDLDALFAFPHEERLCHFRCVERWAMNVPWSGFPLRALLERVEPKPEARYVRFVSARRPEEMPGLSETYYPWPYQEALRLDEAMHDFAFLATGVYGKPLLRQHGAPIRVVVPWKYGYKNPKSIVRIELVAEKPATFWSIPAYAHEYGFLSNVNPNIPHPRWSQATSYWLDTNEPFATPIFNGYGDRVAALYADEPTTPQEPLHPGRIAR